MSRIINASFVLSVAVVLNLSMSTRIFAEEETIRLSVSSTGVEGNDVSQYPCTSAHGLYTVFESMASNLVSGDGNGESDVFVHERMTGQVRLVSRHTSGAQGNAESQRPCITPDGRYVAFDSKADNLVSNDNNKYWDVFIRDLVSGQTERVSLDFYGNDPAGPSSTPSVSADGRYVAFQSSAPDLVFGDTNSMTDIFVRDRQLDQTLRVSVSSSGDQADDVSSWPSISADGRYVAFESFATNLVPGDTNYDCDIFVHDMTTGQTVRVSVDSAGMEANDWSKDACVTSQGVVAFQSAASNLVPGDSGGWWDVFVHDMATGQTVRASVDASGDEAHGYSHNPAITPDGRYVAFLSDAHDIVPGDINKVRDIFVRDLVNQENRLVSVSSSGVQGNYDAMTHPSISPDGCHVAFVSKADNLVSGDNNLMVDIFLHSSLSLMADTEFLPEAGGTINFTLEAGNDNASRSYLLLGSATGMAPGTHLPGGLSILPLNWDAFTSIVITLANTPVFSNFMGTLDASGQGAAQMNAPALPVGSAGLVMYFAYALISPCDFSSNPVAIEVTP